MAKPNDTQELIDDARGIAQGLNDAAEATDNIPLCSRLEQAADAIERLIAAIPEDGVTEAAEEIIRDQRGSLTDAECVLKMMHGAFNSNLECDTCCNAESAARLVIGLLAGVNNALDPISIRRVLEAAEQETEEAS